MNSTKFLTEAEREELEALLRERIDSDTRNVTMLLMALHSGARAKELLALSWENIDFANRAVWLKTLKRYKRKESDDDESAERKREASAEKHRRAVPLPKFLFGALEKLKLLSPDKPFNLSYSRLREVWLIYRPVKKPLHCLRHSYAINAYAKSHDILALKKTLGHSSIQSTMVYSEYDHSVNELRKIFRVR